MENKINENSNKNGRKKRQKEEDLRCRKLYVVKAGFMTGGEDRGIRFLPSLSLTVAGESGIENFQNADTEGFIKGATVM